MPGLLTPFERALNATLAHDPESRARLIQFDQRSIAIVVSDFDKIVQIRFLQEKLALSLDTESDADLTVKGKALTLAKLGSDPDSLFSADIDIHGDVQFAKQLRDLLDGFDFDWEAQLARYTGDTLAYPIAHGLRQFGLWAKDSQRSLELNVSEYLKEEALILPDQSQVNEYLSAVDTLRADAERLEAHIARLKKTSS
ncbi:MAG: ubiquinone biosynthesis protein UbiJ [Methylophagaceae bacterium]|jgi:ubiquinone biosynthesis protein UbiJ